MSVCVCVIKRAATHYYVLTVKRIALIFWWFLFYCFLFDWFTDPMLPRLVGAR